MEHEVITSAYGALNDVAVVSSDELYVTQVRASGVARSLGKNFPAEQVASPSPGASGAWDGGDSGCLRSLARTVL